MPHEPPAVVLVVDDQDAGRFAKATILRRAGFEVQEAGSGSEALAAAAARPPDLAVLDVHLPDMNGLEVGRRLRATCPSAASLQVLHVSGTAVSSADHARGLDQGGDAYLTEPIEPEVLVATVRALLRVRRAERALAAAVERERAARLEVEEASRLKDEFLATLSHELRTPLNAVMGWVWQLRHSRLEGAARERALDSLERNAALQAQLINDLLDISRISKGKLRLEMQLVDLREVIADAVESIGETTSRRRLAVQTSLDSVVVAGDPSRLHQIAANLLSNAVQYTPEGGSLTVTLAAEGDHARFTVQDTGAGIDPSFLPFVFDQFRQGEGRLSRKHGGLGLGLSVVRQLVELHGGEVAVESRGVGLGATFSVTLPRETLDAAPGRPLLDDAAVLLVGDEAALDETRMALEAAGAHVERAPSVARGRALLANRRFDAVLHDDSAGDAASLGVPSLSASHAQPAELVRRLARRIPGHTRA
jgi:signal transduction histidine kinase